jgi:hypothetical protein
VTDLDDRLRGLLDETRFCSCGRELVIVTERPRRRDTRTGERIVETYKECPRFRRGWFNVWMGGWMHDSHDLDHPLLQRRWT